MDDLTAAVVRWVLAARAEFLAQGASSLSHWEQLETRMRAAAKTTTTAPEWMARTLRGLRIVGQSRSLSLATVHLAETVGARHGALLDLIDRETPYVLALARVEAERRKRARSETLAYQQGLVIDDEAEEEPHGHETV